MHDQWCHLDRDQLTITDILVSLPQGKSKVCWRKVTNCWIKLAHFLLSLLCNNMKFFRECLRSSILKSFWACAQCCIGGWVSNHRASSNSSCPAFQQAPGKQSEIVIGKMADLRIQESTSGRWGSVWCPEVGLESILPRELMSDRGEGDMPKKWWRENSSGESSTQWRSSRWWCSGPAASASRPSPSSSSPATSWKSTTPL